LKRRTLFDANAHPSRRTWQQFFNKTLEEGDLDRLDDHLRHCLICITDLCSGIETPFRSLGRPVHPYLPSRLSDLEDVVQDLVLACLFRDDGADPLVIAATCLFEPLLLEVLARLIDRLRERGITVALCGQLFVSSMPPPRPSEDVVVLLGANQYATLAGWDVQHGNQRILLATSAEDDRSVVELVPDALLPTRFVDTDDATLDSYCEGVLTAFHCGDPTVRHAVLCCALGCDLPSGFVPAISFWPALFSEVQDPFTGEDTGWISLRCGQWLAWHALQRAFRPKRLMEDVAEAISDLTRRDEAAEVLATRLRTVAHSLMSRHG